MDHVVYVDAEAGEIEDLLTGVKSMIIRAAEVKDLPPCQVNQGDILYFIKNNTESRVEARGVVSSVLKYENLTEEESFETIIRNQDRLQLPDEQFDKLAGKRCLVLIGLNEIEKIQSFRIDNKDFSGMDDWIAVGNIKDIIISNGVTAE